MVDAYQIDHVVNTSHPLVHAWLAVVRGIAHESEENQAPDAPTFDLALFDLGIADAATVVVHRFWVRMGENHGVLGHVYHIQRGALSRVGPIHHDAQSVTVLKYINAKPFQTHIARFQAAVTQAILSVAAEL